MVYASSIAIAIKVGTDSPHQACRCLGKADAVNQCPYLSRGMLDKQWLHVQSLNHRVHFIIGGTILEMAGGIQYLWQEMDVTNGV